MGRWTKILPVFIVEWMARRKVGPVSQGGSMWYEGPPGVWFGPVRHAETEGGGG